MGNRSFEDMSKELDDARRAYNNCVIKSENAEGALRAWKSDGRSPSSAEGQRLTGEVGTALRDRAAADARVQQLQLLQQVEHDVQLRASDVKIYTDLCNEHGEEIADQIWLSLRPMQSPTNATSVPTGRPAVHTPGDSQPSSSLASAPNDAPGAQTSAPGHSNAEITDEDLRHIAATITEDRRIISNLKAEQETTMERLVYADGILGDEDLCDSLMVELDSIQLDINMVNRILRHHQLKQSYMEMIVRTARAGSVGGW
ncbi:hypothetical protein OPT61_g3076 [Boeremia exigua]|uniref:Uncharacterized protein n=1 Tax=Boeremia exigua TaxID=749465 RepID=A0ACC2IJ78_9PLEO|nr:hypothetical protein OPT61_g3076 [Boeremia exigua]